MVSLKGKDELRDRFLEEGVIVYSQIQNVYRLHRLFVNEVSDKHSVIHAHLPRAELLTFFVLLTMNRKYAFVISRHNSERFIPFAKTKVLQKLSSAISRLVTKRSSAVIAISNSVRDFIISADEIYPKASIHVIHYGMDTSGEITRELSEGLSRVGTVARLVSQKNLHFLLEAISTLDQEGLEFVILGRGPLLNELKRRILDLELDKRVRIVEPIANVGEFYRDIDLFVLPSLYEGFGMVVLEAIIHRVPILASNISTMREILGDDYPGLFDLKSVTELVNLLDQCNSIHFRTDLERKQRMRLSKFTIHNMVSETDKVYIDAINKN